MEQPKKPGAPGARDMTDLKARLGLNRGPAAGTAGPPPARSPFPSSPPAGAPFPGAPAAQPFPPGPAGAPNPLGAPQPGPPSPFGAPPVNQPMPQQQPHDPYVSMRPPAGKQFDLRPMDDGIPVANVKRGRAIALLIVGLIFAGVGGVLGVGFGIGMSGRRAFNETNRAAKRVQTEVEEMHKTARKVAEAVSRSQQRLAQAKLDRLSYDPALLDDLAKIDLDPRPDTSKIFKVDYYRLPDLAVDNLMTYYYDTITLYGEVERHLKRTRADKASIEAFAAKQGGRANYGVVFSGGGKQVVLANLVEMGTQLCRGKEGVPDCPADQLEFQIRAGAGAPWNSRKVGTKPAGDIVAPIDHTPLLEAAMSGSPDQVRMEQYRTLYGNIQILLARMAQEEKQLLEAVGTAAARPDLFSL